MGEENTNTTETNTDTTSTTQETQTASGIDNSAVELEASKRIIEEQKKQMEEMQKQLMEAKVTNAKLIMQTPVVQQREAEEIIDDMFSEKEQQLWIQTRFIS